MRQGPQARGFAVLGNGHPHDQRRAAQHEHVTVVVGARDDLLARCVDRTGRQHGVGATHLADRRARHLHPRQLADVVYDPWIDQAPLRIYTAEQLAERGIGSRTRMCLSWKVIR